MGESIDLNVISTFYLIRHPLGRLKSLDRDAVRLLGLAQQVHLLPNVETVRPRAPAQPSGASATGAASKPVG